MTDLYLYDDVFIKILFEDINMKTVLSVINASKQMRANFVRIVSAIKMPTNRPIRDMDYLMVLVNMSKGIAKYFHNKAIFEGYFPAIRDFAPFSRKMKMPEFMDIMTDVPPSHPDAYYKHTITKSNKIKIAKFIRDSVRDDKKYIDVSANRDFNNIEVAYNLLTNTGNIDIGKFNEKKLTIMFANCSDEMIQGYFGKTHKALMSDIAIEFGRDSLIDIHYIGDRVINRVNLNNLDLLHLHNIDSQIKNSAGHYIHYKILKFGLKMYSREKIIEYFKISLTYLHYTDLFELLVKFREYELITIILLDRNVNLAIAYKLASIAKKYYDVETLRLICEKVEWQGLNEKMYLAFKKKVEKMNLF
jgi:hypothetical protein